MPEKQLEYMYRGGVVQLEVRARGPARAGAEAAGGIELVGLYLEMKRVGRALDK